jgi:hypothetical protein
MISTAFPKDAFKRPERVWPSLNDSWSVASPNNYTQKPTKTGERSKTEDAKKARQGVDRHYLGKGHDSNETEREPQGSIPVEMVRDKAEGDKHEQEVRPRSKEEISERF